MPYPRRRVRVFRMINHTPINMPSERLGIFFAVSAAVGVKINPPIIIGTANSHRKLSKPRRIPNVMTLVKPMIGSVISTMPTAFLGSVPFSRYTDVQIGPHPPRC